MTAEEIMEVRNSARSKNLDVDNFICYLQDNIVVCTGLKRTMLIQQFRKACKVSNYLTGLYRWNVDFNEWDKIKSKIIKPIMFSKVGIE